MSKENVEIDLAAIEKEIGGMSPEKLQAELLKIRTQQKFQQKKMQGTDSHKGYQKKVQERRKLLIQLAKDRGVYDSINEQAEQAAKQKFDEFAQKQAEQTDAGDESATEGAA